MKTALYHIRTRCNYSQSMAARELQVSRQIFSAWEQGKKQIPEGRKAMLASLFGVPIQILDTENEAEIQDFCDRPMFSTICQGSRSFLSVPIKRHITFFWALLRIHVQKTSAML